MPILEKGKGIKRMERDCDETKVERGSEVLADAARSQRQRSQNFTLACMIFRVGSSSVLLWWAHGILSGWNFGIRNRTDATILLCPLRRVLVIYVRLYPYLLARVLDVQRPGRTAKCRTVRL